MIESVSRRSVLAALAAVASLCAVGSPPQLIVCEPLLRLRNALRHACGSIDVVGTLGRSCQLNGAGYVMRRSDQELEASFDRAVASGIDFAAWYRTETISDFEMGRAVRVDGWVISETEFRLLSVSASRTVS